MGPNVEFGLGYDGLKTFRPSERSEVSTSTTSFSKTWNFAAPESRPRLGALRQPQQKLAVAVGAVHGAFPFAVYFCSRQFAQHEGAHFGQHALADRVVPDDALAPVHLRLAGLELRFHQRNERSARAEKR